MTIILRGASLAVISLLGLSACGQGGSDGPAATEPPSFDLDEIAENVERLIERGDLVGSCPVDPGDLIDALPSRLPVAESLLADDRELDESGQVFSGGEVDIVYCDITAFGVGDDVSVDGIDVVRIDIHPGDADLDTYLEEEFGAAGLDTRREDDLLGGDLRSGCTDDNQCQAFWQGDGLFVTMIMRDNEAESPEDSSADNELQDDVVDALEATLALILDELD